MRVVSTHRTVPGTMRGRLGKNHHTICVMAARFARREVVEGKFAPPSWGTFDGHSVAFNSISSG